MPRTGMFTEDQIERMKDAYIHGGASMAKIAVDFNCSVPSVAKYLRKAGAEIRLRGRPRGDVARIDSVPAGPVSDTVEGAVSYEESTETKDEPKPLEPTEIFSF